MRRIHKIHTSYAFLYDSLSPTVRVPDTFCISCLGKTAGKEIKAKHEVVTVQRMEET